MALHLDIFETERQWSLGKKNIWSRAGDKYVFYGVFHQWLLAVVELQQIISARQNTAGYVGMRKIMGLVHAVSPGQTERDLKYS